MRATLPRSLAAITVGLALVVLSACQPVSNASNLRAGYIYRDYPVRNIVLEEWPDANGRTTIDGPASFDGAVVYVEIWCLGDRITTAYSYMFSVGGGKTQALVDAATMSRNCTIREHVPRSWNAPVAVKIGVTRDTGGPVTRYGVYILH